MKTELAFLVPIRLLSDIDDDTSISSVLHGRLSCCLLNLSQIASTQSILRLSLLLLYFPNLTVTENRSSAPLCASPPLRLIDVHYLEPGMFTTLFTRSSMALTVGLLVSATPLLSTPVHAEAVFSYANTPGQLPKSIVPDDYRVHIVPDIPSQTFKGDVTIQIRVLRPTKTIVLNALNLEVQSASLQKSKGGTPSALTPNLDSQKQTLRFNLPQTLANGTYQLTIHYSGKINNEPQGLYVDRYRTAAGEKTLLVTQFEATDARRMLPVWDEPVFRASFKLSIDVPANFKAYSNMKAISTDILANGTQRIQFDRTPKMASYLLSFTAGELERSTGNLGELDLGVITTEGKSKNTAYAIESTKQILGYYNDYFGVNYPLPKLDQVAVPGGFSGAMENWGNIIYNESALLHDATKSTARNKQGVYEVIAHEVAHQWFGNLVTMAWWDNLWLNEGFASWMGTKVTQHFNPDWHIGLQAHRDREEAMGLDAQASSHPIQTPIDNESQAASAFDQITYLKGQSFLRMLEAYLGEQPFRQGLRAYMQKHKYSNATTADLWKALEKASGKPIARLAADWTLQAGFPLVSVDASCNNQQRQITFTQQQFRTDSDTPGERRWAIPVKFSYTLPGQTSSTSDIVLLKDKTTKITRPGCDGALMLDPDSSGYFRIEYSEKLLSALSQQLPSLTANVRLKLLSDTWALVGVKHQPLSAYFKLISHLGNEPEAAVWNEVIGKLNALDRWAQGQPAQTALRQYAISILQPKLKELHWDAQAGEDFNQTVLREALISSLGRFGDEEVITEAKKRFAAMLVDPGSLSPKLVGPVISIVGRYADNAQFEALEKLAREATATEEKRRYFSALFSVNDTKLAERALAFSLDPAVPQLMAIGAVPSVAQAAGHESMAWSFAKEHVDVLLNRTTAFQRHRYLGTIIGGSSDAALADELEAFAKLHLPEEASVETHKAAQAIRLNAKRKALFVPQINAALVH